MAIPRRPRPRSERLHRKPALTIVNELTAQNTRCALQLPNLALSHVQLVSTVLGLATSNIATHSFADIMGGEPMITVFDLIAVGASGGCRSQVVATRLARVGIAPRTPATKPLCEFLDWWKAAGLLPC